MAVLKLGEITDATTGADTTVLTTTAHHTPGAPMLLSISCDGTRSISTVTDPASNTWTRVVNQQTGTSNTDVKVICFLSPGTNSMPASSTISMPSGGVSGGGVVAILSEFTATSTLNASAFNTNSTGEPSVTFTTASVSSIVIATICQQTNLTAPEYAEDSSYTSLRTELIEASNSVLGGVAYRNLAPAGTDTYDPTTGQSVRWMAVALAFTVNSQGGGSGSSSTLFSTLPLLGVG